MPDIIVLFRGGCKGVGTVIYKRCKGPGGKHNDISSLTRFISSNHNFATDCRFGDFPKTKLPGYYLTNDFIKSAIKAKTTM